MFSTSIKITIGYVLKAVMFLMNKLFGVKNKVVFVSFNGRTYSDNPKAISKKLSEIAPDIEQIWLFRNVSRSSKSLPNYLKPVKKNSIRSLYDQATAMVWVDNFAKPAWIYKSSDQIYVQTYHADRGFKKINLDNPNNSKKKIIESQKCDLMLSGSKYFEKHHISSFDFKGEVLKYGSPRCDILVNRGSSQMIKENLDILNTDKILLYAPTYRSGSATSEYLNNSQIKNILDSLEDKTKCKWKCLIRLHVLSYNHDDFKDHRIMDVSDYEDMADLLLISNILITDYSSCAGDFILLNRHVILYQPNSENYRSNERELYFDIGLSPFITAKSYSQLLSIIINLDDINASENCKEIRDFYGEYETGEASLKTAEYIKSVIE